MCVRRKYAIFGVFLREREIYANSFLKYINVYIFWYFVLFCRNVVSSSYAFIALVVLFVSLHIVMLLNDYLVSRA